MFLLTCPMYLIDILCKRSELLYLYSQFSYCTYTNSLRLWGRLTWSWELISQLDTLLDFRGAGGCDSPLVVARIVQYFGRIRVTVTSVNMKPAFAIWCNCVKHCGPCGNRSAALITSGFCWRQTSGFMCGSDWSSARKYLSMRLEWTCPHEMSGLSYL